MQGRGFSGTSTGLLGVNGKRVVCVLRALLLEMSIRYTAATARDGELAIVIDGKGNWSMLLLFIIILRWMLSFSTSGRAAGFSTYNFSLTHWLWSKRTKGAFCVSCVLRGWVNRSSIISITMRVIAGKSVFRASSSVSQ
jgi:hypothetical protein